MPITFSQFPGRHERHFIRKYKNVLFDDSFDSYTDDDLLEPQGLDHEELIQFLKALRKCVESAVSLKPNEESQVLLDLKVTLDKLYSEACALADQHGANKQAISELTKVIMLQIKASAEGDTLAASELEQEEQAREQHYKLLEFSIVADLLHADSSIKENELTATLLSESSDGLAAAMAIFDEVQIKLIAEEASSLLENKTNLTELAQAYENLVQISQKN